MKKKRILSIILILSLVYVCMPFDTGAVDKTPELEYVEGEILISSEKNIKDSNGMFYSQSTTDNLHIDFDEVGIDSIETITTVEDENYYLASVEGDVEDACRELNKYSEVTVQPNYIFHNTSYTAPEEFTSPTSNYTNSAKWYYDDILHIPDAAADFECTGKGVTIAIIDNGYYIDATDFPTNLWKNSNGTVGWNIITENDNISPIYKSTGEEFEDTNHGTNIAGIIGMAANGIGGVGVAYDSELMLIQAATYQNDNTSPSYTVGNLIKAIEFAVNNGADVISISIGALATKSSFPLFESAVNSAYSSGVAIFASAGNEYTNTDSVQCYPAAFPNVIGVMASDRTTPTQLAAFSNYDTSGGIYYDIAAPGVDIIGCAVVKGKISKLSGTSQATPIVAGCAALYLSINPNSTVADLYEAIRTSPTSLVVSNPTTETGNTYYYNMMDAYLLLDHLKPISVTADPNTTAVIEGNYIYGLDEGFSDIESYINLSDSDGSVAFSPTENGNGTGSSVLIYNCDGKLYRTLNVIIYGDLNGDCYADGQDAVIANCILYGFSGFSQAVKKAADVDFDNSITTDDISIISGHAIKTDYVVQY